MIRTALGDIPSEQLGPTDYHEHLFHASPLLPGDDLDDEQRSGAEAQTLRDAGIAAIVDATPIGLGRDPAAAARISHRTGLAVVLSTGVHRRSHYPPGHWLEDQTVEELAERCYRELESGLPAADRPDRAPAVLGPTGEPVRAGALKFGVEYWRIGSFEQRALEAAALAHSTSGAPITVHLESGSAAFEVIDRLGRLGVAADRIALAHLDRNADPGEHCELAAAGAYLGYDGVARYAHAPDSALLDLIETVAATAPDRILLGGDVARRSRFASYGGLPGVAYLATRFVPRLRRRVGPGLVDTILVDNPRRWLHWRR